MFPPQEIAMEFDIIEQPRMKVPMAVPLFWETCDLTGDPLIVWIPLYWRLLDTSRFDEVQQSLEDGPRDVVLCSHDKRVVETKSVVLLNTCLYFKGLFRSQSMEVATNRIETKLSFRILRTITTFFELGVVRLTMCNIQHIFIAAQYLQIDLLLDLCRVYLRYRLPFSAEICFHLASLYFDRKTRELGETAVEFLAENWETSKETLLPFPATVFARVLGHNNLRVNDEDEVVELAIEWSQYKERSADELLQVLYRVRYPHLTFQGLRRVLHHFELAIEVTYVQLCCANRFHEMPVEQLERRTFHSYQIHLIWHELSEGGSRLDCRRCWEGKIAAPNPS